MECENQRKIVRFKSHKQAGVVLRYEHLNKVSEFVALISWKQKWYIGSIAFRLGTDFSEGNMQ